MIALITSDCGQIGEEDPTFKAFKTELELMRALSHENLLRVYTAYIKPPTPCLVSASQSIRKMWTVLHQHCPKNPRIAARKVIELLAGSLDSLLWGRQVH